MGSTLMEAAAGRGIDIEALCGGKQKCGKCRVIIEDGMENLSEMEEAEEKLLTPDETRAGYRLSCSARVFGPVSVRIPVESRVGEMVILEGGEDDLTVSPDPASERYGMAFDIGTTTLVGYLTDLATGRAIAIGSLINPQVYFGEDVMSRIAYTTNNTGGLETLNEIIITALNKIIRNTAKKASINPADISVVTAVGNTAMHHIFLALDPKSLGVSPFAPARVDAIEAKAKDAGLDVGENAGLYVLPNVAGFVGADNVAVLLASKPCNRSGPTLTIDVGTNGEIVLCNNGKMLAASCATGPALEGAHIRHGMRARPGAIEHVKIDPGTFEVSCRVIGDTKPTGICGSGVIDAVAELFKAGILQKNARFNTNAETDRLRTGPDGYEFVLAGDVAITQKDISEVQLAKAALYAGAKILMARAGVEKINNIHLAGAFGSHIDPKSALAIGMLPDCPVQNIKAIGNAAGAGARIALVSGAARREAERTAREIEYIELTVEPGFELEFVNAMHLPHRRDVIYNR
jgi:uncharacterized 2Fe-2S/4Fe-4S cluster protein (DUF4445 family)